MKNDAMIFHADTVRETIFTSLNKADKWNRPKANFPHLEVFA